MSRKNKVYAKIYEKHMNTNSKYEKERFNYFKYMYEQKLENPDFDIYVEQCKLTLRANNSGVNSSLGIYVSSYISLGTFLLGTILGKYMLISIGLAIGILLTGIFTTLIMKRCASKADVWNIALIALEAAYIEKTCR